MKKLLQKAESFLGVDLDGDRQIGKPQPGGYTGGTSYQNGHQQELYRGPQVDPSLFGAPGKGHVKALFIGINYYGQRGQLSGCVNDVRTMQGLIRKMGLASGSFQEVVLVDDRKFPGAKYPTKREIRTALRWLASNNRPGDTLFFHYSGHGGQVKDLDGDEADGYDETIIPVDFRTAGQITDDTIFSTLVAPLPAGVRLTAVMDCCHSGTAMDLPFMFKASEENMKNAFDSPAKLAMSLLDGRKRNQLVMQVLSGLMGGGGGLFGGGQSKEDRKKYCNADVVMFSGCSDSQTSADVANVQSFGLPPGSGPGGAGGACTNAMAAVLLREPRGLRFVDLLDKMRHELKRKGYRQVPQLSSSKPIDLSTPFSFFGSLQTAQVQPLAPGQAGWGYGHGPAPTPNLYHGNYPQQNVPPRPPQNYPSQNNSWQPLPQSFNNATPTNPYSNQSSNIPPQGFRVTNQPPSPYRTPPAAPLTAGGLPSPYAQYSSQALDDAV